MLDIQRRYFYTGLKFDLKNCSLGVVAMPYKPFVINKTDGIEIRVLKGIERALKIHFNITVSKVSSSWGEQTANGTWTKNLGLVYEKKYFGIGNVDIGRDIDIEDFVFSYSYHTEPLVFVVPIAQFVPEWRILTAIFTKEMWSICLGVIIVFGLIFYFLSIKSERTTIYFQQPFVSSLQVFISYPASRQPKNELLRIFYLSLSVFSILIYSAYTCSLINYLKNPIREYQPQENRDILDTSGNYKYYIGGIKKYESVFNLSRLEHETYHTESHENDTVDYWLGKVAYERNIWTVSSSFYAKYLIAENSNVTTDQNGKPKVFVFKNKLMSYSIGMIARKGHPMLKKFDTVIKRMLYGGLVIHYCNEYFRDIDAATSADLSEDTSLKPLTVNHIQGPFFILFCGYILGFVTLILEIVIFKFKQIYKRRQKKSKRVTWKIKEHKKNTWFKIRKKVD